MTQNPLSNSQNLNKTAISRLVLTQFRNYESLRLDVGPQPLVLTGANGAGKTNILEAISFLSPGRGVRGIKLNEADKDGRYPWGVAATVIQGVYDVQIGTGRDASVASNKRIVKIDGEKMRGQAELARMFSVMWLTPQMDGIFIAGSSERRRFLDRLVYNFDGEHASRVYSYEHTVRERARLLQNGGDAAWVAVLEHKMAEKSIAVAAARLETVDILHQSIQHAPTVFPKADIAVEGAVENLLLEGMSALEAEERLKQKLFEARIYDAQTGRTHIGCHRSDFVVRHVEKNMPAALCSTGEQKALLLSIILAEARAKAIWKNSVPVLLLDEVVAHLDEVRRAALFDEFLAMGAQVWLTGTDVPLFEALQGKAQFLSVNNGVVSCAR